MWRFLCAKQKCSSIVGQKRRTNDERRNGPNFRDLIGTNSDRLVRIPIDWSESRTIGPNPERLVRIPNDWSESRTIGPNSERLVRIRTNSEQMTSLTLRPRWTCWCSEICQSVKCQKKLAWTDLDQVNFEKKSSMLKCPNRKIGVDRSRQK